LLKYDYIVELIPATGRKHADVLFGSVNAVEKCLVLLKETISDEQKRDELCAGYRGYEIFRTDEDGMM